MMKLHYRMATVEGYPWVRILSGKADYIQIEGVHNEIAKFLSRGANFSYQLVLPNDGFIGMPSRNGTWNGMFGLLQQKEVDFILGPFAVDYKQLELITTSPAYFSENAIMVLNWPQGRQSYFAFVYLLEKTVWITTLIAFFITTLTMALHNSKTEQGNSFLSRWGHYLWEFVITLFMGGMNSPPTMDVLRILLALWLFAMVTLNTSFTGNLVSSLSTVSRPPLINTVEDLATKFKGVIHLSPNTPPHNVLETSEQPSYKKLYKRIMEEPRTFVRLQEVLSDEVLKEISNGDSCTLLPEIIIHSAMDGLLKRDLPCSFRIGEEGFQQLILVIGFNKQFDPVMREKIGLWLLRFVAVGLLKGEVSKRLGAYDFCLVPPYSKTDVTPIDIKDLLGICMLWAAGCALGMITLGIELMAIKYKKKNRTSNFVLPAH